MTKKRIIKDYDQLPEEVINQLKLTYPTGFSDNLIKFVNAKGEKVSALPFETEEIYYLIRMTVDEAIQIIEEDEDYDEFGNLDSEFKYSKDGDKIAKEVEEEFDSKDDEDDWENIPDDSYNDDDDEDDDD